MRVARELDTPAMVDALARASQPGGDFRDLATVARETQRRGGEIGRGGRGPAAGPRDGRLGREVAIKELIDERLRARFEQEARLTARLQHPAIVGVYEAGRWPTGEPFYAMKFV